MRTQNKIILIILIIPVIILLILIKVFFNSLSIKSSEQPSKTISDSKDNGVFVEELEVKPKSFIIRGKEYIFKEAWVEKRSELAFVLGLFKERTIFDEEQLVFSFNKFEEIDPIEISLKLKDENKSLAFNGSGKRFVMSRRITDKFKDSINVIAFSRTDKLIIHEISFKRKSKE